MYVCWEYFILPSSFLEHSLFAFYAPAMELVLGTQITKPTNVFSLWGWWWQMYWMLSCTGCSAEKPREPSQGQAVSASAFLRGGSLIFLVDVLERAAAAARLLLFLGPVFSVFPERQAAASAWCLLSSLHRNYSCPWMQLAQTTGELTNASPLPRLPVALNPWWMGTDLKCPDLSPLSRLTQRHTVSQNFHQD